MSSNLSQSALKKLKSDIPEQITVSILLTDSNRKTQKSRYHLIYKERNEKRPS